MEKDRQYIIWVDWDKCVISFHREAGFAEVRFPDRDDMIAFAVEKSESGFSIQ